MNGPGAIGPSAPVGYPVARFVCPLVALGATVFLGMTPGPASWEMWKCGPEGRRNVNLAGARAVGARGSPVDSWPQLAQKPSSGGGMLEISSSPGRRRRVSTMWSPRTARAKGVGSGLTRDAEGTEQLQILRL